LETHRSTHPRPLWRNRDYLLLWSGQGISVLGTQISQIAFPLLVLALTGSAAMAGLVAAARSLPHLLFTLLAGALVDRWDRKRTMILCSGISALALASVVLAHATGALTIEHILLVSLIEGTCAVFFRLAETSALPQIVSKEQLPAAIAQQQVQYAVGAVAGPPLGGALFSVSQMLPILVDAGSYAASCLSLTAVRARLSATGNALHRSLRHEIAEGLLWLWRNRLVRFMSVLTGGINFVTSGAALLIIVLTTQQGAPPMLTGLVFAAAGAGAIVGAVAAPFVQRRFSFGQVIIGACWFQAAVWCLFPAAATPVALMLVVALGSLVSPIYDTVQMSYRLALIPDALQGRVNSVFRLLADGMKALGAAATGLLLEQFGATTTLLLAATLLGGLAVLATLSRSVRQAAAL
jgi:MFS family permease